VGMVYALGPIAMVRLGSAQAPNIQSVDNRVPAILEKFHEQLAAEELPLTLELLDQPTI